MPNGIYAKQLFIVRNYTEGEAIDVKVDLTANHNGFFVFSICPSTDDKVEVTQKCLDSHQLTVLNSNSTDKYLVPNPKPGVFTAKLKLPEGLTCKRCVFQWTYTVATRWGECPDGTHADGCGPQETFRACADVKISSNIVKNELDNEINEI